MLFYGRKMGGKMMNKMVVGLRKSLYISVKIMLHLIYMYNGNNNLSLSLTFCCFVQGIGSIIGLVSLCFCYIVIYLTAS